MLLNIVFTYQQYTRHGVVQIAGTTFDIKNIIATFIGIICLVVGRRILKKQK